MEVDLNELLSEIPLSIQAILREASEDADPLEVAREIASMPGMDIAAKGGGGWGMQWWERYKELMIEFLCSGKKGTLSEISEQAGPLKPASLISAATAYTAAGCGIPAAMIVGITGAVLYQVLKRGKQAWCDVVYTRGR